MFRFTIREILLLTMVVALVIGWWVDRERLRQQVREGEKWRVRANALAVELKAHADFTVIWKDDSLVLERGGIKFWSPLDIYRPAEK